jgi:hypothetical protein
MRRFLVTDGFFFSFSKDEISKLPTYAVTDKMKAAANATSKGDGQLLDIDQFELEVNKRRGLIPQSASENAPSQVTWQLCDDVAGGVGILPNGDVPRLELPVELDDFNLATFLISETELATCVSKLLFSNRQPNLHDLCVYLSEWVSRSQSCLISP